MRLRTRVLLIASGVMLLVVALWPMFRVRSMERELDPMAALLGLAFAGLILGWLWIIRSGREPGEN